MADAKPMQCSQPFRRFLRNALKNHQVVSKDVTCHPDRWAQNWIDEALAKSITALRSKFALCQAEILTGIREPPGSFVSLVQCKVDKLVAIVRFEVICS